MQNENSASPVDLSQLHQDLGLVQAQLHSVYERLAADFGENSMAAYRAYEAEASIQRLRWQVQRQAEPNPALEALYDAVESHVIHP